MTTCVSQFRSQASGFDPRELFDPHSSRTQFEEPQRTSAQFLGFAPSSPRAKQKEWIAEIEALRRDQAATGCGPNLTWMTASIPPCTTRSARTRRVCSCQVGRTHDFTFLIEDPATVWNLGPQRYPQIAAQYQSLTPAQDKLAMDINIVERYQDVYPTKQQTGAELFELVHMASSAFPRVALYFENSILPSDMGLLSAAASTVNRAWIKAGRKANRGFARWLGDFVERPRARRRASVAVGG